MTEWEGEIDLYMRLGNSEAEGHQIVLLKWLKAGDTRPLAWALCLGKPVSPGMLAYVGLMLLPPGTEIPEDMPPEEMPYRLEAVRRTGKAGNVAKPGNWWRDLMTATVVKHLMANGLSYEKARFQAADDWGVSDDTAMNAYRKWFGRGKQSPD
jgi:hypothetical protein